MLGQHCTRRVPWSEEALLARDDESTQPRLQIDDELLFYLEARGIPEAEARALLVQAFVGEAIERIEDEALREALGAASADWLGISPE